MPLRHGLAIVSILVLSLSAMGQEAAPPRNVPNKNPIERLDDGTGLPAHVSKLKLRPNATCRIKLNDRDVGIVKKGEIYSTVLASGLIKIDASCIEFNAAPFSGSFRVLDTALQTFYDLTFVQIKDTKAKDTTTHHKGMVPEVVIATPDRVHKTVDYAPEYQGGEKAMVRFIENNIVYPKTEKDSKVEGTVLIRFTISTEGTVTGLKILKSVSLSLDKEALRVAKMLNFIPAIQFGQKVPVQYDLPVVFKL